jgi:hypothetical protein
MECGDIAKSYYKEIPLIVDTFFLKIAVEIKLEFSGLMGKDFVFLQNGCPPAEAELTGLAFPPVSKTSTNQPTNQLPAAAS